MTKMPADNPAIYQKSANYYESMGNIRCYAGNTAWYKWIGN